jgi:hypothetical protein
MLREYDVLPDDQKRITTRPTLQARALSLCDSDFLAKRAQKLSSDLLSCCSLGLLPSRNGHIVVDRYCSKNLRHAETMLDSTLRNEFQSCVAKWEKGSYIEKMLEHRRKDRACLLAKRSIMKIFRELLAAARTMYENGPAGDVTLAAKEYLHLCSSDDSDEDCFTRFLSKQGHSA